MQRLIPSHHLCQTRDEARCGGHCGHCQQIHSKDHARRKGRGKNAPELWPLFMPAAAVKNDEGHGKWREEEKPWQCPCQPLRVEQPHDRTCRQVNSRHTKQASESRCQKQRHAFIHLSIAAYNAVLLKPNTRFMFLLSPG
jgi:hypothetical protein